MREVKDENNIKVEFAPTADLKAFNPATLGRKVIAKSPQLKLRNSPSFICPAKCRTVTGLLLSVPVHSFAAHTDKYASSTTATSHKVQTFATLKVLIASI